MSHCGIIVVWLGKKNNRLPLPNLLSPAPGYSFQGLFLFSSEKENRGIAFSNVALLDRYG